MTSSISISLRRVLTAISLGSVLLFASAARADSLDDVMDAQIGIVNIEIPAEKTPAPVVRRDPSTVGARLPGRRTVDLAFADDDEGHRTEVVHTPAPVARRHRGRRSHRRNVASR